jgi:hypothetical protein
MCLLMTNMEMPYHQNRTYTDLGTKSTADWSVVNGSDSNDRHVPHASYTY